MGNRIAILATLCLVLMPWGYFRGRQEIAAWQAAEAQRLSWQEKHAEALEHWNLALEWDPSSSDYLLLRAETKVELGQIDDALADTALAYQHSPDSDYIFNVYCLALARAGKHADAVKLLDERLKAVDSHQINQVTLLRNSVAYHLALGNQDLDRALELVNLALVRFPHDRQMLDTRGYVNFRRGQYDAALKDADQAIQQSRASVSQLEATFRVKAIDERDLARLSKLARQELAVLLYHRLLIHNARLEQASDEETRRNSEVSASLDRSEIRNLGFIADDRLM